MSIAKILLGCAVGLCLTVGAFAQDYPTKPVQVINPFPVGFVDTIARTVSQKLSELWGQPVVVESRPGAGGTVAAGVVAKAPPDGYTLLLTSSAHAIQPALYTTLPYDPLKDFVDIAPLARQAYVLVVGPSAGVKSVSALIAAAKAKPGQLTFGSPGTGTGAHFTAEKFKMAAGIDVVYVPSQGVSEANADTITGRVTYWFPALTAALPDIRDGKLLPLGVSSAQRSSVLPEVPTIAESGVADYDDTIWVGLWAPAGTPASVVDKLAKDVARVLAAPDVRAQFATLGAEPMSMTSAEFTRFVRSETEAAARIMKAAGIKPQ